jgi:hypothetical protein
LIGVKFVIDDLQMMLKLVFIPSALFFFGCVLMVHIDGLRGRVFWVELLIFLLMFVFVFFS